MTSTLDSEGPGLEKGQIRMIENDLGEKEPCKILMALLEPEILRVATVKGVLSGREFNIDLREGASWGRIGHAMNEMEVLAWASQ